MAEMGRPPAGSARVAMCAFIIDHVHARELERAFNEMHAHFYTWPAPA